MARHTQSAILPIVTHTVEALLDIRRQAFHASAEDAVGTDPDHGSYAAGVRDLAAYLASPGSDPMPRLAAILNRPPAGIPRRSDR